MLDPSYQNGHIGRNIGRLKARRQATFEDLIKKPSYHGRKDRTFMLSSFQPFFTDPSYQNTIKVWEGEPTIKVCAK